MNENKKLIIIYVILFLGVISYAISSKLGVDLTSIISATKKNEHDAVIVSREEEIKNNLEAIKYYQQSAELGSTMAATKLGQLASEGRIAK